MKKFLILFITYLFAYLPVFTQVQIGNLTGQIVDTDTRTPVSQATLQLFTLPDTIFTQGKISDSEGRFHCKNLKSQNYRLKISFVGYTPQTRLVKLDKMHPNAKLDPIYLSPNTILLDEAIITAEAPPVTMIQDTTVFHSSAYRVAEGAMLEDLVKKLPGAEVSSDGKIMVNGKEIKRIMIDGKEFFSDDTQMALKNLPVEMIDKVKAYDKKSDLARMTGIDDGEEEAVLDLTVKKDMKKGWFGNFIGGYGNQNRYEAGMMVNRFTDRQQVSVIGSVNNTNNQGFAEFGDAGQGMGGKAGTGINTSQTTGINFTTTHEKLEVGGDIKYGHSNREAWSKSNTETFLKNGSSFKSSKNTANRNKHDFATNLRMEWNPDSLTNILFRPSVAIAGAEDFSTGISTTQDEQMDSINHKEARKNGETTSIRIKGNLQINRKLRGRKGRNLTLRFNYNFNSRNADQWSYSQTRFFKNDSLDVQDRYNDGYNSSHSYKLQMTYTEPFSNNRFLLLSYSYQHRLSHTQKDIYNSNDNQNYQPQSRLDSLSNRTKNTYITQELQATFRTVRPQYMYNIGFNVEPQISTTHVLVGPNVHKPLSQLVWNFSPAIDFRFRFNKHEQIRLLYRGKSVAPQAEYLQAIIDITDPMNLFYGNPELKPSYTNRILLFYNKYSPKRQRGLMANISFSNTLNSTAHRISYDAITGAKETRLVNVNGNWNLYSTLSFNTPFKNRKFTFNTYTNLNYQNLTGFASAEKNLSQKSKTRNLNLLERIGINYRNNLVEIGMTGSIRYGMSHNNIIQDNNKNSFDYETNAYTNLSLPWSINFSTDISYNIKQGYGKGFDRNTVLWNAQLSKDFLKNKQATLRIKIYDILKQQSNLTRTITANHTQDIEYNTLNGYFIVHFVYRLNTLGGKTTKNKRNKI